MTLNLLTGNSIPQKHVLKCSINRVVDGIKQYLFLVINQGRYSGYLDLPGGKINKGSEYELKSSESYPIKLSEKLLQLFKEIKSHSYLLVESESSAQCVGREVREEAKIPIDITKLRHLSTHNLPIKGGQELLVLDHYGYESGENEGVTITLSSEHTHYYRLTEEQMEQNAGNIVPSLRYVLGLSQEFVDEKPRALEAITYSL